MNIEELAECIFSLPKLNECNIQHWLALDQRDIGPEAGTSGGRKLAHVRSTVFRVFMRYDGKFSGDIQKPTLDDAVLEAFRVCGVNITHVIEKLEELHVSHRARQPKSAGPKDKEFPALDKAWKSKDAAFVNTLHKMTLMRDELMP